MATNNPKVSVCIPTYNYGHFISDAMESVITQSFQNFELLVIDNCSTDKTQEVVNKYIQHDNRIKFIINKSNLGLVNNMNKCLQYASGEFIKILAADDLLSHSCLEILVNTLDANQDVVLASCARTLVDKNLQPLETVSFSNKSEIVDGFRVVHKCLTYGVNYIGEPTAVIFRKKHAARGFSTKYRQLVDLEMWFHILEFGKFAYINEPLCSFRIHEEQQTKLNIGRLIHLDEPFMLLEDYLQKPAINLSMLKKAYISYITAYRVWKLYKRKQITLRVAIHKIKEHYGIAKILGLYPFYKFYKIYRSLINFNWV